MTRLRLLTVPLAAVLLCPMLAHSQTATTGRVAGTVTDPTGAVLPGARVELKNMSTGVAVAQTTNTSGQYTFPNVAPGGYSVTVTMDGFRTGTVRDLQVQVTKSYTVNVTLEVGQVTQVVEVVSEATVELQTSDATVGNTISGKLMYRFPTFTRQANELLTLQPGVAPDQGQVTGARRDQSTFTLDGIDVTNNSVGGMGTYMQLPVDGVEEFRVGVANPNAAFGRGAGGQVAVISRRGSNDFHGAAFWYHQNDNLNANTWDRKRLGKDPTTGEDRNPEPELKDNRFGFRVGGPVLPERTFFFAHYEGRRFPRASDIDRDVPTATLRQGILQFRDGTGTVQQYDLATSTLCGPANTDPCDPRGLGLSPTISALWAGVPTGNDPSGGDGLNTIAFRDTVSTPLENDYYNIRLDHNITDDWRLDAAFRYFKQVQDSSAQVSLLGGDTTSVRSLPNRQNMLSLGLTGQITPNLTGDFRFGWVRTRTATQPMRPNVIADTLALQGTNTPDGFIGLDIARLDLAEPIDIDTQVARKQANDNRNFQWNANLNWVKGSHTIQFGAHLRRLPTLHIRDDKVVGALGALVAQLDAGNTFNIPDTARPPTCSSSGQTNCIAAADVDLWDAFYVGITGMIDNITVLAVRDGDFNPLPFGTTLDADTKLWAPDFYVQDVWRVTPSLTVTFGLNYGWQTAPREKLGRQTIQIDAATGEEITNATFFPQRREAALAGQIFNPLFGFVPINSVDRSDVFDIDWDNIGPRASAAWSPSFSDGFLGRLFGERKTVIRGGFSLVYDRQNTVQSVIIPTLGVGFAQTLNVNGPTCDATGAGGANCAAGSSDPTQSIFRVGVDGTIPTPVVPQQTVPVVPWNGDAGSASRFPEIFSFQVDPAIEVGENYAFDLSWQREIPGNMLIEIGYAGRYARKLPQSVSLGNVPYMHVDSASGQSFAQAFDVVATELRNGVSPANVTPQPWFENNAPQGTVALAQANVSNFINGRLNSLFLSIDSQRSANGLQPFNNYLAFGTFMRTHAGISNYNGLFITARKRTSHGLTFDFNYTLGRSNDQIGTWQNSAGLLPNSFDLDTEYGPSNFDVRHLFNGTWLYELPFRNSAYSVVDKIVGGWFVSGIFTARSGEPLRVSQGSQVWGNAFSLGNSTAAIATVDPDSFGSGVHTGVAGSNNIGTNSDASTGGTGLNLFGDPENVFNSFRRVLIGADGRTGRGMAIDGLGRWNVDMSLGKRTEIKEGVGIVFQFDFFNIFNNVNFDDPGLSLTSTRSFGVIDEQFTPTNRTDGSRWIQFGLRVEF